MTSVPDRARLIWAAALLALGLSSALVLALPAQNFAHAHGTADSVPIQLQPELQVTTPLTNGELITWALYMPVVYSPTIPVTLYLPTVSVPHPLAPGSPYPAQSAEGQSPNAYLAWSTLEPTSDLLHYDVYLEANNPQPTTMIAQGLTKASFDPATFALDTQYFWRVVTIDPQGQRIEGPVWMFRVEPLLNPPAIDTMIPIPAGEFLMGCDRTHDQCIVDGRNHVEVPLHAVYLDAYEIDKYEVTNVQYRACTAAGACPLPRRFTSLTRESYFYNPDYDYYPVLYVSWWDAQTYCAWAGKRLPTEAEWEKAARSHIDTRKWPWGEEDVDCNRANHRVRCVKDTTQVGAYPTGASPYGLMDMTGNVFEWVSDMFDAAYYSYSPYYNPQGPAWSRHYLGDEIDLPDRPYFTIRGGSCCDNWWYGRIAHRHWGHHGDIPNTDRPFFRTYRVGFRCARAVIE